MKRRGMALAECMFNTGAISIIACPLVLAWAVIFPYGAIAAANVANYLIVYGVTAAFVGGVMRRILSAEIFHSSTSWAEVRESGAALLLFPLYGSLLVAQFITFVGVWWYCAANYGHIGIVFGCVPALVLAWIVSIVAIAVA
jgi:hypothetical protein